MESAVEGAGPAGTWSSEDCEAGLMVQQKSSLVSSRPSAEALVRRVSTSSMVSRRSSRMSLTSRSSRSSLATIYDEQVEQIIKLENPDTMRAVPFSKVLSCFGSVWASSQGTAEDYELSTPVWHIDQFLSHAWATPRFRKVIALLIYYNFLPGVCVALVFATSAFVAKASGALNMGSMEDTYFIVGESTWLMALAFFHEVYRLFGPWLWQFQSMVFLDKLCIHQTDHDLKHQGIRSLPAFLEKSRSMVILYGEAYLTRLWTIYELATYLLLKPDGHVEILPVDIPLLPMIGLILVSFTPRSCFFDFWWVAEIIGEVLVAVLCLWLARLRDKIDEAFRNFDIYKANCFDEADRDTVEYNVEAFMKHTGEVPLDADKDEAMAAFNNVVHERVPQMMRASMGPIGIPFRITIMVDIPGIVQVFDLMWRYFWTGDVLTAETVGFLLTLFHWVLIGPIALAAGITVTRAFGHREGFAWVALTLAATFAALNVVEWVLAVPFLSLAFLAQHHLLMALGGLVAYCCCLLMALIGIYGMPTILTAIFFGQSRSQVEPAAAAGDLDPRAGASSDEDILDEDILNEDEVKLFSKPLRERAKEEGGAGSGDLPKMGLAGRSLSRPRSDGDSIGTRLRELLISL